MSEYKTDKNIESIPIEVVSENDITHTMEIINQPSGDGIDWGYIKDNSGIFVPFTIQTPEQEYFDRKIEPNLLHRGIPTIPTSKVTQYSSYHYFSEQDKGRYLLILTSSASDYASIANNVVTMTLTNAIEVPDGITYTQLSNNQANGQYSGKKATWGAVKKTYTTNCTCTTTFELNVTAKGEVKFYGYSNVSPSSAGRGMTLSYAIVKLEDYE